MTAELCHHILLGLSSLSWSQGAAYTCDITPLLPNTSVESCYIPDPDNSVKVIVNTAAAQLWKYLEDKYLKKEGITSFYEFSTLFRCNLVNDGNLEQQINKLSDMHSICTMNKFKLQDWQFSILVLHALPSSYCHIPKNILIAGKIKDLKFSDVR